MLMMNKYSKYNKVNIKVKWTKNRVNVLNN